MRIQHHYEVPSDLQVETESWSDLPCGREAVFSLMIQN